MSIVCSSRVGSMFECGMATVAMLSLRRAEASSASFEVAGAGRRDSLGRRGGSVGKGWVDARSGQAVIASSRQGDRRWRRVVCRCLRTRGGREEGELEAEADEARQRSEEQQAGLKSPDNTDSNAPLA